MTRLLPRGWPTVTVLLLVFGLGIAGAQGPRRDIGRNIPLPASAPEVRASPEAPLNENANESLITIEIVATDSNHRPLRGLLEDQFTLLVDGEAQTIESFEEVDGPVTAAVVIEFSALLNRSAFDRSIIPEDRSLAPAAGFIQSLRAEDWAALVGYDGRPWIDAEFTRNKGLLVDRIRERRLSTTNQLASAFYDAVYLTLDRMKSISGTKAMVLFSSGWDTGSRNNYGELLDIANASDTTIYSVGMSEEALLFIEARQDQQQAQTRSGPLGEVFFPDPLRNLPTRGQLLQARAALRSLADASGGTSFFPVTENQYDEMLEGIDVHLRSRYRLGFLPRNLQASDELREISVELAPGSEVPDPDSVTFQHKKGFYF